MSQEMFSLRFPTIFVAALIAVPLGAWFLTRQYISYAWDDASHAQLECAVATELAAEILMTKELGERVFSHPRIEFGPTLAGSPIGSGSLPLFLEGARTLFAAPSILDCRREFVAAGLPIASPHFMPVAEPYRMQMLAAQQFEGYEFSRIVFLLDKQTAEADVTVWCGNLCGYGWHTIWGRKDGHWTNINKKLLRIS